MEREREMMMDKIDIWIRWRDGYVAVIYKEIK